MKTMFWSAISRRFSNELSDGPLVRTASRRLSLVAALTSVALLGSGQAVNLYWDNDVDGDRSDGNGTWDDVTTFSWLAGITPTFWDNSSLDSAIIGSNGPAGDITVAEPITVGSITFADVSSGNYRVIGSTLNLAAAIPHFIRVVQADKAPTILSEVAGGGAGLVKLGDGTLILGGTNTYSGPTFVVRGALRATNSAALGATGASNGTAVGPNGTLELSGNIAFPERRDTRVKRDGI